MACFTACFLVSVAAAAPTPQPGAAASVSSSSTRAGASPVALTLQLHYEMQCGSPGRGPLTIRLPAQMSAPPRIAKAAVRLNGKAPASVTVGGSGIVIGIPPRRGVMCDVVEPGTLTVVLESSAGIGNPKSAGAYTFTALEGSQTFRATLRVG